MNRILDKKYEDINEEKILPIKMLLDEIIFKVEKNNFRIKDAFIDLLVDKDEICFICCKILIETKDDYFITIDAESNKVGTCCFNLLKSFISFSIEHKFNEKII